MNASEILSSDGVWPKPVADSGDPDFRLWRKAWFGTNNRGDPPAQFCRQLGFDPHQVKSMTYEMVDMPLIRITLYLENERGTRYLACYGPDRVHTEHEGACEAAVEHHDVPVPPEGLPDWWQPA